MGLIHVGLTNFVLGSFFEVYNTLGYGFLEKVYQNALYLELSSKGHNVVPKKKINVYYRNYSVGEYYPDLIVDNTLIVELKAMESLALEHEMQLINYLRGTDMEIGLLLNFGKKPQFRRKIFSNSKKAHPQNPPRSK